MQFENSNFTRRQFLQRATTSALAGYGLSNLHAEPDKKPAVKFAFTMYGMRKLRLEEAVKVCSEIGYDSLELVCMADWHCAPEFLSKTVRTEILQRLTDNHLTVASLMENVSPLADEKTHAANLDRLRRACELGHDLSPNSTPVIETVLGGKPAEWNQVRAKMAERLQEWGKVAETGKAIIALKPHVGGALHTPDGAIWLKEQLKTPWLKLGYDFSHFELQAFSLSDSLKVMLPETVFIHLKDSQGTPSKFQFLLPGDGQINYRDYFKLLKTQEYRGPLVVEVSGQLHMRPEYDPVVAAKHCYTKLAPILKETGLWKSRSG